MSDCRKCAEFSWCLENEDCGLFKQKPQTNADRIRAMTDEEIAKTIHRCPPPFNNCTNLCDICTAHNDDCEICWLKWLKQEVTE